MALDLHLDVLLAPDEGGWLAHCLQLDLAEWGETREAAHANLLDVVRAHVESTVENDNLEHLFHPAPPEVWERFLQGELLSEQTHALDVSAGTPAGAYYRHVRVREASLAHAA